MFSSIISCPVAAGSATVTGFICQVTLVILSAIPVLVSLALLYFLWGLSQWILNLNNEEKIKEGRERMLWGLVALFFIFSIGGVIAILMNTFFGGGGVYGGSGAYPAPGYGPERGGSVTAPISVTIGTGPDAQDAPGFFRGIWCEIGFGDCQ